MVFPHRKPNRMFKYDYSQSGAYFITICTQNRNNLLCAIVGGGVLDAPRTVLSDYGKITDAIIHNMQATYHFISVDKYVIMPNHVHLLLSVIGSSAGTSGTPSPTNAVIPSFVSTLKRFSNKEAGRSLWQRSYHDRIIRNEAEYLKVWQYIEENPAKWELDCFYNPSSIPDDF